MNFKKYIIALITIPFALSTANAQEKNTKISLDFRVNTAIIDSTYLDNAKQLKKMREFLKTIEEDSTIVIKDVSFSGAASPEGPA